jgi:hypothetical protein
MWSWVMGAEIMGAGDGLAGAVGDPAPWSAATAGVANVVGTRDSLAISRTVDKRGMFGILR